LRRWGGILEERVAAAAAEDAATLTAAALTIILPGLLCSVSQIAGTVPSTTG
jgi:hypothetical protein